MDVMLKEGPSETSEDATEVKATMVDGVTVGFEALPPTFQQFDADGKDAGSHPISALGDVLDILGATTDDIGKIKMIYTHGHMDHIGLANHAHTNVTKTMGRDPVNVPIIATNVVLEHFEHSIETGLWSYHAPLPTETFEGFMEPTVGQSTALTLMTLDGHL